MLNLRKIIYLIIFFMPLYFWWFSFFGIPVNVLEMMIYALFLFWVYAKIKSISPFEKGRLREIFSFRQCFVSKQYYLLNIGIILLFFGAIISTALSSDIRTSLGIFKGWFVSPFLFFIVFINTIKKREHILWSLKSWLASGVAVSLIGIFYLLSGDITFDGRLRAFFLSPNHLAMYISPAFLIATSLLLRNRSLKIEDTRCPVGHRVSNWIFKLKRHFGARALARICAKSLNYIFGLKPLLQRQATNFSISNIQYLRPRRTSLGLAISIIIIAIPLYFTYSYGAFLGIFAGMVWLFYKTQNCHSDRSERGTSERSGGICNHNLFAPTFMPKYKDSCIYRSLDSLSFTRDDIRYIYKKPFLKILIFTFFIIFVSITASKFDQIINSSDRSSFHSRLMIWNTAGEIIKDNPLFGIGPGTFQETYLSYAGKFSEPYLEWAVPQPHNIFLAFYLQTGLIGFVGFILILIWFFSHRDAINRVSTMAEIYIINALMIYTLIHGLVDTTYWKNDLSLIFWLLIGLAVVNNADSYKIKPKK